MKNPLTLLCLLFCFPSLFYAQQTIGLFYNESSAYNGYTLISPLSSTSTYLIDNCGREIHTWPGSYTPGLSTYLTKEGDLLRAGRINGTVFTSGGLGGNIRRTNWDGDIVWEYQYTSSQHWQHHDFEILPSGNLLLLAWEYKTEAEALAAGRDDALLSGSLWPEHLVEVQPVGSDSGVIVWEWHLWDHLVQEFNSSTANYGGVADHPELIDLNFVTISGAGSSGFSDWIHANGMDYSAELDQIIISSRTFSEFWVIDHSTSSSEAASHSGGNSGKGGDILYRWGNPEAYQRGTSADRTLFGQHDVHWISPGLPDAGKILIFNNGAGRPDTSYSTVEVLSPPIDSLGNYSLDPGLAYGPSGPSWHYPAPPSDPFYASYISGAQRLPNGNTLICDGPAGNIFEITPSGDPAWEYTCPIGNLGPMTQGDTPSGNSLFRANRYSPLHPGLADKDLSPGAVLEMSPLPSDCEIFVGVEGAQYQAFEIFPNPCADFIRVKAPAHGKHNLQVLDLSGKVIHEQGGWEDELRIECENWNRGIYFLRVEGFRVEKMIKF